MSRLEIRLLGPMEVTLDGAPVTGFESNKVRLLLAYLSVEANRPQLRDRLAGLLWPDWPQKSALSNLRYALADLRKNIGDREAEPPFLNISRESIQLNPSRDCWVDVVELEQLHTLVSNISIDELQHIVRNYRGSFLNGFSVEDSPDVEDWVRTKGEYYRRLILRALVTLSEQQDQYGEYDLALGHARRAIEIEPWYEPAHRQVMRLLAQRGRRAEAAAHFERLKQALRNELNVEPSAETQLVLEQIRLDRIAGDSPAALDSTQTQPAERQLPMGTVTFLFTDIQGSTPLWESQPEQMAVALQIHNTALRRAIEAHGGIIFKFIGDEYQAAFATAPQALKAAVDGQRALQAAEWNELGELNVRMGLHTGEAQLEPSGDDYAVSHTKNRAGRIRSAAHGGQVLLSQETADLVLRTLPKGVSLKDLGEHHLKGMEWLEHLYQVCAPGLAQEFPPLTTTISHPNNLPLELTSFIGREDEIETVCGLLSSYRLVTLTGSGGVGKTRLSIQVAGAMIEAFPDGVWYIELAHISDPERVPQAVAGLLGLREDSARPIQDVLVGYLKTRQILLVLDNCEHLLTACARLADHLLRKCLNLKIFSSSREALGIAGEMTFHVPSLAIPDPSHLPGLDEFKNYEAVRLFAERARVAVPTFQVETRNMPAIAQICRRLDGIPLALELAAPRLKMLTTAQLASRLDNAFRLLTGGSRTALPRHQTLQATIDWSYQLLAQKECLLLQRLAVFAGGFSLEGVEKVCAGEDLESWEIFDHLASLVDKSIVNAERDQNNEMRYRMLETVHQYARQKLFESGISQVIHDRHLQYYLDMAETIEPQLKTSIALERLSLLSQEAANLRAALSWASEGEDDHHIVGSLRLACALLNFWHTQNFHNEGYTWLLEGLKRLPEQAGNSKIRAKACFSVGHLILPLGRIEEARKWMEESLSLYQDLDDRKGFVTAQSMLGEIYAWEGSFDKSRQLGEASVALSRSLDDPWLLAWVLCRLGTSLFYQSRFRRSFFNQSSSSEFPLERSLLEESLSIFERLGDLLQVGDHLIMLASMALGRGDLTSASMYFNRCLAAARGMKSKWTEANALSGFSYVAYSQGDFQAMKARVSQSLTLRQELGFINNANHHRLLGFAEINLGQDHEAIQHFKDALEMDPDDYIRFGSLVGILRILQHSNEDRIAAQLLGALKTIRDELGTQFDVLLIKEYERALEEIQQKTDSPELSQAHADGQRLTLEQAVALALEEIGE